LVKRFRSSNGGKNRACYGQMTVCWAETEAEAQKIAKEWWPVAALPGKLMTELTVPDHFEAVAKLVSKDALVSSILCSRDPDKHRAAIRSFSDAGFDHVYIHQVGPDQEGFFRFYEREILSK
jgi:coenzyme F420-dependent glucose-6-phosphate dehydrogenase